MESAYFEQINKRKRKTANQTEVVEEYTGRKRSPIKGRSIETYRRKLDRLKRTYAKLYSASENHKKVDQGNISRNRKGYFFEKYPTEESYLKNYKVKESNTKRK